jgi:hypothetical protein
MRGGHARTEIIPFEEYRYVLYAREFGWTPAEVDELPLVIEPWLLPIHSAIADYENEQQAKAIKEAQQKKGQRG